MQICGLCAEDGHEISFAPDDIAALMKGYEESADGSTFVQAMYCLLYTSTLKTWTIMETLVGGVGFLVALIISFFA